MKTCIKCNINKPLDDFHIRNNKCRVCVNEIKKINYENNKDAILLKRKTYRENNKEKIKEYYAKWTLENKEYIKQYRKLNKDKINKQEKIYKELNKDKINLRYATYNKKRLKTDELYKLCKTLRRRIRFEIKRKGYVKTTSTTEILGCTIEQVKTHLEQQFKYGMNWSNHGEWHIDHIIPLSSAKNKQEVLKLCHYTNLQPLWANENLQKGSKLNYTYD